MAEAITALQNRDGVQLTEALKLRLAQIDKDREALIQRRRDLDAALNKIDEERGHITALLGLKGAAIEPESSQNTNASDNLIELVATLLTEKGPMHYREIERELRTRGWFQAGGADPANTLLARYFQDPRFYRPARGVYALRPNGKAVQSVGAKRRGLKREKRRQAAATRRGEGVG
jgi:hypothetical protein